MCRRYRHRGRCRHRRRFSSSGFSKTLEKAEARWFPVAGRGVNIFGKIVFNVCVQFPPDRINARATPGRRTVTERSSREASARVQGATATRYGELERVGFDESLCTAMLATEKPMFRECEQEES